MYAICIMYIMYTMGSIGVSCRSSLDGRVSLWKLRRYFLYEIKPLIIVEA